MEVRLGEFGNSDMDILWIQARNNAVAFAERDLQSDISLRHVSEEIQNINTQNALLHNQLTTLTTGQIEEASNALRMMNSATKTIEATKKNYEEILARVHEGKKILGNYKDIRTTQIALANVQRARDWLRRILNLKNEVTQIQRILKNELSFFEDVSDSDSDEEYKKKKKKDSDSDESEEEEESDVHNEFEDLDEEDDNILLLVQERISELENFRASVLDESEKHPELTETFAKYLSVIDEVSVKFTQIVNKHLEQIYRLAEDEPTRLVRIVRIIEREEKREKMMEEAEKADRLSEVEKKKRHAIYKPKEYKRNCFKKIDEWVRNEFDSSLKEAKSFEEVLKALADLIEDLEYIEREVIPCFPRDYGMMQYYALQYDTCLRRKINEMREDGLDNEEKTKLIEWMQDFPDMIGEYSMYMPITNFQEDINILKGEYLRDFSKKMNEWCEKIVHGNFKVGTEQQRGMFYEENDRVYTYGPVDFFTFVSQAISSASHSELEDIVLKIAYAVRQTLDSFCDLMYKALMQIYEQIPMKQLCAHMNDCEKCANFTTEMEEGLTETLPDVDQEVLKMDDVINSFNGLYQKCEYMIENRLFNKASAYFNDAFVKNMWYQGSAKSPKATDSNADNPTCIEKAFDECLTPEVEVLLSNIDIEIVKTMIKRVIEKLMVKYIDNAIKVKFSLSKSETELVKRDIERFEAFIHESFDWRDDILDHLHVIQTILTVTNPEDFSLDLSNHLATFHDLLGLLKKRNDLSGKEAKELTKLVALTYETQRSIKTITQRKPTLFLQYDATAKPQPTVVVSPPAPVQPVASKKEEKKEPPPVSSPMDDTETLDLDDFLNN